MDEEADFRCDIRAGTSGFDYADWEGPLYPRGLGRGEYFGAYSESFGTLELVFPGPELPDPKSLLALVSKARRPLDLALQAGPGLAFQGGAAPPFKAEIAGAVQTRGRGLDPAGWKKAARVFAAGLEALAGAGRLCAAFFGFPFSFRYRDDERRYLDRLLREFSAFPLAVEFGNAEWINARLVEGLKARSVGLCSSDFPRIDGLPPVSDLVTSKLAYVRFHGRNAESWSSGGGRAGCSYRYSDEELAAWLPRLEAMSVEAAKIRVFFRNRRDGNAPRDAMALGRLARAARLI